MLYYGWRWVWYATAVMFLLNNTFIQVSQPTRPQKVTLSNLLRDSMS